MSVELHLGDCLEVLRGMAENSVDSIVTDPPYGLRFMGKRWDHDLPAVEVWVECLRVLKPGGHFIFSCEVAEEDEDGDFVLRDTGRYAHKRSSVERLCREAGFEDIEVEQLEQLRLEGGQPLPGYLVVARKPAQPTPLAA